jgi:hypothetical protein
MDGVERDRETALRPGDLRVDGRRIRGCEIDGRELLAREDVRGGCSANEVLRIRDGSDFDILARQRRRRVHRLTRDQRAGRAARNELLGDEDRRRRVLAADARAIAVEVDDEQDRREHDRADTERDRPSAGRHLS